MSQLKKFSIVVAVNNDNLIGTCEYGEYGIPWPYLRQDMNFFRKITTTTKEEYELNGIIIGHNTWKTLSDAYRKNKKRYNIVVTRDPEPEDISINTKFVNSFEEAVTYASNLDNVYKIFAIGGSTIYSAALKHPNLESIYLTHVKKSYPINVERYIYFPINHDQLKDAINLNLMELEYEKDEYDNTKNIHLSFKKYNILSNKFMDVYLNKYNQENNITDIPSSKNEINCTFDKSDEYQYLDLVNKIMNEGIIKNTRNGKTRSIFGYQLKYDLSKGYPIQTVKKSYPKAIFEELMWMIRGSTDVNVLQKAGVHIWDKNSSRDFLDKNGLDYDVGDIGPGYGFQMRYFGATYENCKKDYSGQGIDQLKKCIEAIKNNPTDRRIIINLWNPVDINKMALPPCHILYNFGVDVYDLPTSDGKIGRLNCHLMQRSWDVLLGWNTTTAALLTYLLAHHCNLEPGILVHSITDAHLYQEHIDSGAVKKLLERTPRKLPTLNFTTKRENIEDYTFDDLMLEDYYPCPAIFAEMVA
ncbi:bifunctional dihydrofolate reductase-thymidylate synthase [Acanthamoeba polyphaga moumouvirus]|uniref:thymidylate synthase n=1 Tax=Acanthamoeba polyphaga moumouvirus TaxID=1269028 RepID=L7RCT0_9VIRU|nr:bifunctional dihydrofolate reductase-thymidylate synthase [Acanthamoeba polyphaga moumouvirus]AGC01848.1 bifunctional dihydrofolate reductase-thymidylate synthase [Acanthamoeba polyphaga moumouvirus]AQN68207.1 bifunctional dihydrofolate reductase-thymidylate synthase [Saudi moumouvirus]